MPIFSRQIRRTVFRLLLIGTCLTVLLLSGCSDRGTNTPEYIREEWGLVPRTGSNQIFDFPGLYFQPQNPTGIQLMTAYMPKASFPAPTGTGRVVPLLVLLAPQFGSQDFYFNTGSLFELAQEMTLSGEIDPMAIVCLGSPSSLGGFFYGQSIPGGDYDNIMGGQFIFSMVFYKGYNIRLEREKHAISGFGTGAYGAVRQAMLHPSIWGSVSAVDGPLDFDGADGNSGLIPLFDSVVAKFPGDPNTFYRRFDTSSADPIRSMIVSAALTFSAADTGFGVPTNLTDSTVTITNPTLAFRKFLKIRNRLLVTDSTTLVDSFFRPIGFNSPPYTYTYSLEGKPFLNFLLPFLPNGDPYAPIWNLWMRNNPEAMNTQLASPLANTSMYLISSDNARFGFRDMTRSFATTMKTAYTAPGQVQTYEYGGYNGLPATEHQYTYDLLRKILLYHDAQFKKIP